MTTEFVTLSEEQIAYADKIAQRRYDSAIQKNRQPHNGAPTDPGRALSITRVGTRGEAAGKVYLNPVKWNAYAETLGGLADLEDWIDVKTVTRKTDRLIVQKDDDPTWAYLLIISAMHPTYEIVGWCWGYEAQKDRYWRDPVGGRAAYFVPQNDAIIKAPRALWHEVRDHQMVWS